MANLKNVIYLSNEDYETLVSTGTVTIDGETLTYDENNVYITPDKLASTTEDGLMSSADKVKLNSVESGAQVNVQANWTQTTTTADDYIKNKPTLATVATSGSYNDLTDKPTIPEEAIVEITITGTSAQSGTLTAEELATVSKDTAVIKLINSADNSVTFLQPVLKGPSSSDTIKNFMLSLAQSGNSSNIEVTDIAITVSLTTGTWYFGQSETSTKIYTADEKTKLAGIQAGAEVNVNADWNATSGDAQILNKPTIPTVNDGTLSIQSNGTTSGTFSANQSSNQTINLKTAEVIDVTHGVDADIKAKITANHAIMLKYDEYYYMPQYADGNNPPSYYNCFEGDDGTGSFRWLQINWTTYEVEQQSVGYATSSSIPTVNNGTLSIQGNGTTASTFTANQSTNTTLNIKGGGRTTVSKTAEGEITISSTGDGNDNQTVKGNGTSFGANDAIDIVGSGAVSVTADTTNKKITISAPSVTDTNQKVKAGSVTFGNNDVVDIVAGDNVTVTGLASGTGAPKITISSTDTDTGATSVETTGSGNVVNSASYDASTRKLTLSKGVTALTSHQSIKSLNTTATTAQSTVASEAIAGSGSITLHKVSKTGTYSDLIGTPTLGTASAKDFTTSVTSGSADLVTSGAVSTAINNLPKPMIYKGTLGTGGTITSLPTASSSNEGFTYKVITAGTYASQSAKVGDMFISNGSAWTLVPSGDEEFNDTWRNIKVNGTEVLGSAISTGAVNFKNGSNVTITGSGNDITIASSYTDTNQKIKQGSVTFGDNDVVEFVNGGNITITGNASAKTMTLGVASGYSIPSTSNQTSWTNKYSKPSGGIPDSDLASTFVKTVDNISPVNGNVTLTGYAKLNADNTFTGNNVFSEYLGIDFSDYSPSIQIKAVLDDADTPSWYTPNLYVQRIYSNVDGWDIEIQSDVEFNQKFNPNTNGYGLTLPSTTSWTANKVVATTDDLTTATVAQINAMFA